jgi:hypothetical protein
MALDPQALVSVEEARTYLGVPDAELPADPLLEQIIGGLSLRVKQRTGRTYINDLEDDKAGPRVFEFDPSERVVAIDDCRELGDVEVTATPNEEEAWELLPASEFVAEPVGEPVTRRIRFFSPQELPAQGRGWGILSAHVNQGQSSIGTPWPRHARAEIETHAWLRVTAKWGFGGDLTTVPANAKLAVLMWIQNIHKRDQAFFSDDFGKAVSGLAMPKDVAELLDGEERSAAAVSAI